MKIAHQFCGPNQHNNNGMDERLIKGLLSSLFSVQLVETHEKRVSECWRFYAVPTARVIFTKKTSLDVFCLSREQVWTFSVLGDRIYEMRCPFVDSVTQD